jgi:hypothetical protein
VMMMTMHLEPRLSSLGMTDSIIPFHNVPDW